MAVTLKLLVDNRSKKVVYAEARKEFVDFLLGLMELPLASILRLLHKSDQIGDLSIGKLYESARDLREYYLQQTGLYVSVVNPNPDLTPNSKVKQNSVMKQLVTRTNNNNPGYQLQLQEQKYEFNGYVKGAVVYMVMDDLTVTPSTISAINLFNTLGIKDTDCLREMIVRVNGTKALKLVRAAFQSSTVLTDTFLPKPRTVG